MFHLARQSRFTVSPSLCLPCDCQKRQGIGPKTNQYGSSPGMKLEESILWWSSILEYSCCTMLYWYCIAKWISHSYTWIPLPSVPSHQLITAHWVEFPVLYTARSHQLSILYLVSIVYICRSWPSNSSPHLGIHVFILYVWVSFSA